MRGHFHSSRQASNSTGTNEDQGGHGRRLALGLLARGWARPALFRQAPRSAIFLARASRALLSIFLARAPLTLAAIFIAAALAASACS